MMMSEFDSKARDWDKNQLYIDRSEAVAEAIRQMIPVKKSMKALEYGSGTALLSFALRDELADITLMDNSREMTQVAIEKIEANQVKNMNALFFDLEHQNYSGKFDIIYNQMVMHHVNDIDAMLSKFYDLLNPGGYLAIADLYSEDGTFHGEGFTGHLGFDVNLLATQLRKSGFENSKYEKCFVISRTDDAGKVKEFPLFMMVAGKL